MFKRPPPARHTLPDARPLSLRQHVVRAKYYARQFIKKSNTELLANQYSDETINAVCIAIADLRTQYKNQKDPCTLFDKFYSRHFENVINRAKKYSLGNCEELAFLALDYFLTEAPHIPAELVNLTDGDHILLLAGRTTGTPNNPESWNPDAYFCDPWANLICTVETYLMTLRQNNCCLKNYLKTQVYYLSPDINLGIYLPNSAYQKFSSHQVLYVREAERGSLICDPTTGQPKFEMENLIFHIKKKLPAHIKLPSKTRMQDLAEQPFLQENMILKYVRIHNFIEPVNHSHGLSINKNFRRQPLLAARKKETIRNIYNQKFVVFSDAILQLKNKLDAEALRLQSCGLPTYPKYQIINNKQKALTQVHLQLKNISHEIEGITSYILVTQHLSHQLQSTLTDCYRILNCTAEEEKIIKQHRHCNTIQHFFNRKTTTEKSLAEATNLFNTRIKKLIG